MAEIETAVSKENHPLDLIRVKNPTNRDFTFYYDSIPHLIAAGEEQTMARWMALHYADKLMVAIINSKIKPIKQGERTIDSLRTNDPNIRSKLAPYILLFVVQRFVEPTAPAKSIVPGSGPEFKLSEFAIGDSERSVETTIELPEAEDADENIFGLPEETVEPGFSEVNPGPAAPEGAVKPKFGSKEYREMYPPKARALKTEKATSQDEGMKVTGDNGEDLLGTNLAGKKTTDELDRQDLLNEARALELTLTGTESDETLAQMIKKETGS